VDRLLVCRRRRRCGYGPTSNALRNSGNGHDERQALRISFGLISTPALALAIGSSFLALDSLRTVNVVGVHRLVLFLLFLCEVFPVLTLVSWKALPLLTDRFGQISLALLLRWLRGHIALAYISSALRQIAILTAFAAEEDERVLGPLDVILVTLLRTAFADVGDGGAPATVTARG